MELAAALDYARRTTRGVLVTEKSDGRPQLSNIMYAVAGDGTIRISVTADRAKTRNALRDPRVSLYVTSADFWSYVVIEGSVELSPLAGDSTQTLTELREVYRAISASEHPDWADYDRAMAADRRQVLRIRPAHAYGALPRS